MNGSRAFLTAVLGAAALAVLGCADAPPLGVGLGDQVRSDLLGGGSHPIGLLTCTPQPYDSTTQPIGPDGGVIAVGAHRLTIPPSALDADVAITAVAPSDTVNQVRFQPEGLQFRHPASLTMSYANCGLLGWLLPKRIAYVTDDLGILSYLLSLDNLFAKTVTGRLDHFSGYAVAW